MANIANGAGILGLLILGLVITSGEAGRVLTSSSSCAFPAIYSFGDSNSDTGGMSAALGPVPPPNGQTFFGKPSGRLSDGRLIIDFTAEYLGLPYGSPYLDALSGKFGHGANFASAGSTIRPGQMNPYHMINPFHLIIQVVEFIQFKYRTAELHQNSSNQVELPNPEDFSKALYTIDIGQSDLAFGFINTTDDQVPLSFPDILNQFSTAIGLLYKEGARAFLVNNVGPIGCAPFGAIMFPPKNTTYDKNRCAVSQNAVVQQFNSRLKETVIELRKQLPLATITYVDIYQLKYSLVDTATNQGFKEPWTFCCGTLNPPLFCGTKIPINVTGDGHAGMGACPDPSKHISWDGIHFTEAANKLLVKKIIDGSASDPAVPINEACPWNK